MFRPSSHRKDKSRMNAQSRRTTHAQLLKELGSLLPFPEKVVQQIDYNSILRLVLCYFRMKNLAIQDGSPSKAISMFLHLFTYVHVSATHTYMQCTYLHVWRKLSQRTFLRMVHNLFIKCMFTKVSNQITNTIVFIKSLNSRCPSNQ